MEKDSFKSRLGFLLVSAGCAIGIGNVWKFPYITGIYGGGVFVLFYILFLIIMGLPVLTMELAVGRASRKSTVMGYKALEPKGSKWHIHGWVSIAGCYILMMYYTTVSGWMLSYFVKFLTGTFASADTDCEAVFNNMMASPTELLFYTSLVTIVGFIISSFNIQAGLERITKIMMLGLLLLIIVLVVNSFTLSGAAEGLKFYLLPDIERAKESGIGNIIAASMNQAFFTLSIGMSSMEIFGSYMSKDKTLTSEGGTICILDSFVAICAGLIIFPACFSFGVEPTKGPALIFMTLPQVFMNMPAGNLWGALFFLFMTFASFSTVIAVFENLIKSSIDNFGAKRKKASVINCIVILIGSIPCVLGFNLWSNIHLMGDGSILDFEDFIVSNLMLPIGAFIYI
ncbi:MAG: sodium-dependent transporter, partial [Lachnospiraceae bacterium]|nr:sodium-dependent transporter [Lachnospiraceae bacterium]